MFSAKNKDEWKHFIEKIPDDQSLSNQSTAACMKTEGGDDLVYSVRERVRNSLERVHSAGDLGQTWRVSEHKSLGRPSSPILVTAIRIK